MPPPGDGARGPRPRRGPDAGQGHGLFRATRYAHDHPGVVAVRARPAPKFELDQGRLVLPTPIAFATASAELAPDSDAALAHVAAWLTAKRDVTKARIEVHVDLAGAEGQELSLRRSLAVARWLVERGVDCERLVAVGFGDTKPLADATTPEGRAQNVRVEVRAAELRGRAIGGAALDGGGGSAGDPCAR